MLSSRRSCMEIRDDIRNRGKAVVLRSPRQAIRAILPVRTGLDWLAIWDGGELVRNCRGKSRSEAVHGTLGIRDRADLPARNGNCRLVFGNRLGNCLVG